MKEEKEIRQQLLDSLPEKGNPNAASFIKAEYLERQEAKKRKKGGFRLVWAMPVAAAVLAVAIVTPLAINSNRGVIDDPSVSTSGNTGTGGGQTGGTTPQVLAIQTKHEDVAINVENALSFLTLGGSSASPLSLSRAPLLAAISDPVASHIKEVNPFLPSAERMMWNEKGASSLTYSEGEEYPYALSMEDGAVLRYKETKLDGSEADEDEEEFLLEGYIEGTSYSVKGKRENEVNPEEEEYETEFTIFMENSSITIESESETEEGEYEESYLYRYRENGQSPLLEVTLTYEKEEGEEDMFIEYKDSSGETDKYTLYKNGSSGLTLYHEFKFNEEDYKGYLEVTIDKDNALYIYKDSEGNTLSLPRA